MAKSFTTLRYSLFVVVHSILFFDRGFAQTWVPKNVGQFSGSISAMIFFNDTLYVGTQNDGIYASADRGQNWKQVDQGLPEEADISSFAVRNDTLFTGLFFGGLYFKTTKSKQWNAMTQSGLQNLQITSLLFLNNKLYAGTVNGVYLSSNRNAPWQSVNNGFPTPSPNTWIGALCPVGNSILASDNYQGTYLLQPNGTWAADTTGMNPKMNVSALENIQGEIYCGTTQSKLYLSEDNGATWLSIDAGLPVYDFVSSISFYQTQLLAGLNSGKLISSTNKGATWTILFSAPSAIKKILVDGTDIFLGTYADGVYKSSDGGATWLPTNVGLINAPITNLRSFNGSLYATSNENLYRSDNSAKTWNVISNSIGIYDQFNLALLGDSLIALSNYSVSFSVDKGITWQPLTVAGKDGNDYFTSMYSYRDNLFAGSTKGIYQFDKKNNIWQLNQLPGNSAIYCFFEKGDSLLAGGVSNIFLSLDHGTSWAPINADVPTNFVTWNLISVKSKLLASSNSGVFSSKDNGKSWTKTTPSSWGSANTLFSYKGYVFAGLYYNGIYFSSDGGDTWKSSQKGFPFPLTVNSFTALNDTIYAGTTEGVWACALKSFGPSISSFTPQSGSPGTIVTIYGANFDSEISYDSVYFNGSAAKILAASDNGLSVVVPSDATTGPIRVTIEGQKTTSSSNFTLLLSQSITLGALADATVGDRAFTISASSSSGLAVNFTSSSNKVTLNGNLVTVVSAGRDTITATQSGNASYGAAPAVKQSFCIKPAKPTVTLSGDNTATVTLTSSAPSGNQWFLNGTVISGAVNATLGVSTPGAYTVQTKADDCVSAPSDNLPIIVTGDIILPRSVSLYPNPSRDYIFITGIKEQVTESTVIDLTGKYNPIKLERQSDLLKGDISYLTGGTYVMRITEGTQVHEIKFIKQ